MKINYLLVIALALALVFGTAFFALFGPSAEESVKVGYTPILSQLPLFVAVEEGYFEEEGIEVELVKFDAPNHLNDALLQGQIDITCPGMALGIFAITEQKNPGKIEVYSIVGGTPDAPVAKVLVRKESEIRSVSDIKGKKLGIFGGTIQWIVITKNYLEMHGLKAYEDVEIVELTPALQVQALASGQIDALLALEPMATVALEQGFARVVDGSAAETTINNPSWIGAGAINTAYKEKNPEKVEAYLRAIKRGIEFTENRTGNAIKHLPKYTPVSEELAAKVPLWLYRTCDEIGKEELEGMQNFYDLFTKYGVVEGRINTEANLYCKKG